MSFYLVLLKLFLPLFVQRFKQRAYFLLLEDLEELNGIFPQELERLTLLTLFLNLPIKQLSHPQLYVLARAFVIRVILQFL